ncbi:hypothetical protein [Photobacterium kishitanii]|uniref:hypothetical protein n=1 Tax=Photobacterium kishitanii TaxID=318456 RepID=UPI0004359383
MREIQQERNTLQVSLSDLKSTHSTNTQRLEQSQSEVVELKTNIKQHVETIEQQQGTIKHYEDLLSKESNE